MTTKKEQEPNDKIVEIEGDSILSAYAGACVASVLRDAVHVPSMYRPCTAGTGEKRLYMWGTM